MYEQFQNIMKMGPFSQIMVGDSVDFFLWLQKSGTLVMFRHREAILLL